MPLYATPLVRAGSPQRVQVLLGLVPKQVLLGLVPNRSRLADQAIEASLQLVSATFTARQSQSERKVDAEEKLSLGPHADVLTAIAIAQESTPSLTETRALENVTLGTYDGVRWLSGGVGEFERQAIMETVAVTV
ncbi:hypothetical protein [Thiococcus pfennigii]|uniref:hypothetical protein n=1 Tax=Thiococcus pfennigii TaxID=1057 RepID=UPI001906BFCF|nr:hypothetical protein [Thiococcus pfennigii]